MRRALIVLLIAAAPAALAHAQDSEPSLWFVRGGVTPAFILPTNPFAAVAGARTTPIDWSSGFTMEIGRRTDGSRDWHELYGMPEYGVGFSIASFRNSTESVRPNEAYGFFSWPFASLSDRVDLTTDFGVGVSWNWRQSNAFNPSVDSVLGSNLNARIDWGFYLRSLVTPRTFLYTGLDYTHRSNGGLVQPNVGINVLGPKLMMQYNFGPMDGHIPQTHDVHRPEHFDPEWAIVVGGAGGAKNVVESIAPLLRRDFATATGSIGVQRKFYMFGRFAGGVDAMYDGSTNRWLHGVYGGYEHLISRFGAGFQMGYRFPGLYQRYGLSYQLAHRTFATFAVRATEGRKADTLEIGLGYRLR